MKRVPGVLDGRGFDSRDDGWARVQSIIRAGVPEKTLISLISLHPKYFMHGNGGNVRRPAVIRGKWAENRVPRELKNVHFPDIAARDFPDARIWGKCTEKG